MVHPNIMPLENATVDQPTPRQPRVEYLATLSRHSAAVNVVRFSPNGESYLSPNARSCIHVTVDSEGDVIASAGDGELYTVTWPACTDVR